MRTLLALWDDYAFLARVHMVHEDDVIFPNADEYLPHHSDPFFDVRVGGRLKHGVRLRAPSPSLPHTSPPQEHKQDERLTEELLPLIAALRAAAPPLTKAADSRAAGAEAAAALSALGPKLTHLLEFFETHLQHEEDRLSPIMRKNKSLRSMRVTLQQVRQSRSSGS